MKKLSFLLLAAVSSLLIVVSPMMTRDALATESPCDTKGKILTFKPWYSGLTKSDCSIKNIGSSAQEQAVFIWTIALNILDNMFQLVGYLATGYIVYGGFLMLISEGSPDQVSRARRTIIYAVAGLVIAIMSIAIVNMISSRIT